MDRYERIASQLFTSWSEKNMPHLMMIFSQNVSQLALIFFSLLFGFVKTPSTGETGLVFIFYPNQSRLQTLMNVKREYRNIDMLGLDIVP